MMGDTSVPARPARAGRRFRFAVSGALIVIPVALGLAVPLYQRDGPALAGIPFFYWFQMTMAILAAAGTSTVYRLLYANESDGEGDA
jgi:hypothetical protein